VSELDPLEQAVREALQPDAAPQDGDGDLLGKLVDRVVQTPPAPPAPTRPMKMALRALAVGGTGLLIAAGTAWLATSSPKKTSEPAPIVTPAPSEKPTPAPQASAESPVMEAVPVESLPRAAAPPPAPSAAPQHLTAADLFSTANAARNHGRNAEAVAGYQALQRDFPDSVEAKASHVMLGRVLLERSSDPQGALAQFDAYLAAPGTLREEALIGRARSLDRLGRIDDSRKAWKTVVDAYPSSIYADEARARLQALDR